jgi:hypothetical protein
MLAWAVQTAIMSIILIFLVHHLISFFTLTLTVPKIKDLVNTSTQKYEHMFDVISNTNTNATSNSNTNANSNNYSSETMDYTLLDLLPKTEDDSMKNELKSFLKKQLNKPSKNVSGSTEIADIDSLMGTSLYSKF